MAAAERSVKFLPSAATDKDKLSGGLSLSLLFFSFLFFPVLRYYMTPSFGARAGNREGKVGSAGNLWERTLRSPTSGGPTQHLAATGFAL